MALANIQLVTMEPKEILRNHKKRGWEGSNWRGGEKRKERERERGVHVHTNGANEKRDGQLLPD